MGRRTRTSWAPRPEVPYLSGPYVGMRDSVDPTSASEMLARMLQNCYPVAPQQNGRVVGVPGIRQAGEQTASSEVGQLVYQFTKNDGTEITVKISGGKFYTYNWGTNAWTETLTAAHLSGASITLSTTARCYAVTFANEMIVTDGVNKPWAWDGTAGSGLTSLTNAPVAFGPPAVYYAKLFFIKAAERSTMVWSEENLPNTGYEAGGYNNAWGLTQTDRNLLYRLLGSNESLLVFRARSITQVTGPVTQDFQSSGTREAVSEEQGTTSPDSVHFDQDSRGVFFVNADGQPHWFQIGASPADVWQDFAETIKELDDTEFGEVQGFYDPDTELHRFAFQEVNETSPSVQLCYHTKMQAPRASCLIRGFTFDRVGVVEDGDGRPRVMYLDDDGNAYYQGLTSETIYSYELAAGTVPIQHIVGSHYLGYDNEVEKGWDRIDISFFAEATLTSMDLYVEGPRGQEAPIPLSASGGESLWDSMLWDTDNWGPFNFRPHVAVGLGSNGRFIACDLVHAVENEPFGFLGMKVSARLLGRFPSTP